MKKIFFISLTFVLAINLSFAQISEYPYQKIKSAEIKIKIENERLKSKYDIGDNYDIKYYRLEWFINPETLYIKGKVSPHFVITKSNTQLISLELADNLVVDSVLRQNNHLDYTHTNRKLEIDLNTTLEEGILDSITIYYQGVPIESGGFSSFTQNYQNGVPIIWTLSQPYGSSDWWPCKNALNDKIDSVDIIISTPSKYKAASNGILINETSNENITSYHWKHRYPIEAYLIGIAVTQYSIYSDFAELSTGQLEILNYVFPANLASAKKETPQIIPIIQLFDSLFGAYPFHLEKYGHAQFGWNGGMEHQTMSFMKNFSFDLMAHELAHSWFGNAITCNSWKDVWLNEGFATYLSALTYEYLFTDQKWNNWKSWTVNHITNENAGSVYCPDTSDIYRIFNGRLSYYKGAYVLHMLRWLVGDENFYQSCRNYLNDNKLRYNYAKTEDLQYHFEKQCNMDLDWFFQQWIYGEGHPSYFIDAQITSTNKVLLFVKQTQSHPSVEFFKMPLPIKFSNNEQDTTLIFNNTTNNQDTVFQLSFTPTEIIFDPNLWILSRNNNIVLNLPQNEAKTDIMVYPNPVKDKLNIETSNAHILNINIIDMNGKIVTTKKLTNSKQHTISTARLSKGNYILNIRWENGSYNSIISKQ